MLNAFVALLLRSPLHGAVSKTLMLLTVTGRTTGRTFTFPVQYVARNGTLLVVPGRPDTKSWWRNLSEPGPVRMRLRGRDLPGTAEVIREPGAVEDGLRTYVRRFPRSAKGLGIPRTGQGDLDTEALRAAAGRNVIVQISLD